MSDRRLKPPSGGDDAPQHALLGKGNTLDLVALAGEICRRYRLEYPDKQQRYGDAGIAWCVHDNQYLLDWAVRSVTEYFDMDERVAWLASVLESRDFPTERLARNLDIGAAVIVSEVTAPRTAQLAKVFTVAAKAVRQRPNQSA
jgi:hypothetical protein